MWAGYYEREATGYFFLLVGATVRMTSPLIAIWPLRCFYYISPICYGTAIRGLEPFFFFRLAIGVDMPVTTILIYINSTAFIRYTPA